MSKKVKWDVLYDDTNLTLGRHLGNRVYHFVRITDMDDACGRDNEGHPKYVGELDQVDLNDLSEDVLNGARSFTGAEADLPDLYLALACVEYGAKAPLWGENSGNRRELERAAKRESRELSNDPDALEAALDKPVNAIGSTAREYARGDIDAALSRGLAAGEQKAQILAQMQAPIPRSQGLSMQVDMSMIQGRGHSDDPIPYSMGFMHGFQGTELPDEREELADAYLKGRELGADVRLGRKPLPEWIKG